MQTHTHMCMQWRNPDPSPQFSPASPLSLINNSSLTDGSPGRVEAVEAARGFEQKVRSHQGLWDGIN